MFGFASSAQTTALFTVEDNQFVRPGMYLKNDFKTLSFYQNNATRYAVRDARKGMTSELVALGIESADSFVTGIPDAVKNLGLGLWDALNPVNFKDDLVSNKNTILEGHQDRLQFRLDNPDEPVVWSGRGRCAEGAAGL